MGDIFEVVEGRINQRQIAFSAAPPATGIWFNQQAQTYTDNSGAGGVVAELSFNRHDQPTIAASVATVYTDVATVKIEGAPIAGALATLTNTYSLWVDDGLVRLDGQVLGADGAVGAPEYSFLSDPDTGMYLAGANIIAFVTNSLSRLTIGTSGIFPNLPVQGTNGTVGIPAYSFASDSNTGLFRPGAEQIGFSSNGTERMRVGSGGIIFIGDGTTTSNADMTLGLDINQLGNDNQIAVFRSTDVDHGVTDIAETNVYLSIAKAESNSGGTVMWSLKDADGVPGRALRLFGVLGENADTTKTTASHSIVQIQGFLKAGASVSGAGANQNVIGFGSGATFAIFDAEGTLHLDLGGNGTAAAPALTFAGDVDTGLLSGGANTIRFATGGATAMLLSAGQLGMGIPGSTTVAAIGNTGDLDTGIYWPAADVLGLLVGGNPLGIGDAAITLAAAADTAGGDIFVKVEDGGTSTGVGRAGASYTFTGGDGSDAALASGLAGGDGGIISLVPGTGGAGDGAGAAGTAGYISIPDNVPTVYGDGGIGVDGEISWNGALLLLTTNNIAIATVGFVSSLGGLHLADARYTVYGTGSDVFMVWDSADWLWRINGADLKWNSSLPAGFPDADDTNAPDTFLRLQDGGAPSGAGAGFDGATFSLTTGDGSDGAGAPPVAGGDGGGLLFQLGNGGAGAGGGAAGADGQVIFDLVDSSGSPDILPGADDEGSIGLAGTRWSLVRATTITSGDLNFENDWKFTEAWEDGTWGPLSKGQKKSTKGLYIFNHRGDRMAWLDNEGNIHARGQFFSGWVPA